MDAPQRGAWLALADSPSFQGAGRTTGEVCACGPGRGTGRAGRCHGTIVTRKWGSESRHRIRGTRILTAAIAHFGSRYSGTRKHAIYH